MQVFKRSGATGTNAAFNFYTFIFTAVCLAGIYTVLTFFRKRGEDKKYLVSFGEQLAAEAGVLKKVFVFIALMAVCLFFNSYLTTIASGLLSPSVLSPHTVPAGLSPMPGGREPPLLFFCSYSANPF